MRARFGSPWIRCARPRPRWPTSTCPIRPGTDIAFLGGLAKYAMDNSLWQPEYVLNFTNASYLMDPAFSFDASSGAFFGWDPLTAPTTRPAGAIRPTASTRGTCASTASSPGCAVRASLPGPCRPSRAASAISRCRTRLAPGCACRSFSPATTWTRWPPSAAWSGRCSSAPTGPSRPRARWRGRARCWPGPVSCSTARGPRRRARPLWCSCCSATSACPGAASPTWGRCE